MDARAQQQSSPHRTNHHDEAFHGDDFVHGDGVGWTDSEEGRVGQTWLHDQAAPSAQALISYRIVSYREKNPHIVSISYRVEKKLIATGWFV